MKDTPWIICNDTVLKLVSIEGNKQLLKSNTNERYLIYSCTICRAKIFTRESWLVHRACLSAEVGKKGKTEDRFRWDRSLSTPFFSAKGVLQFDTFGHIQILLSLDSPYFPAHVTMVLML